MSMMFSPITQLPESNVLSHLDAFSQANQQVVSLDLYTSFIFPPVFHPDLIHFATFDPFLLSLQLIGLVNVLSDALANVKSSHP